MYQVIADGIAWIDSDGIDAWPDTEANTLADMLYREGYDVDVVAL